MPDVRIISDSGCDVFPDGLREAGVHVIPFPYALDGQERMDDPQSSSALDDFYHALRNGAHATTAQVRTGDVVDLFRRCAEEQTAAVYITLSSGLSATYDAALSARDSVLDEYPEADLHVVDSLCASAGQALLVIETARRLAEGSSAAQAAEWAEANRLRVHHLLTVDSFEHLLRGGRVSPAAATAGSILDIKPIIMVSAEGKLVPIRKVRGRHHALKAVADLVAQGVAGQPSGMIVSHAQCAEDASELESMIRQAVPGSQIDAARVSTIIGAHTGPSAVIVAFWGEPR
jgi:DegV family protein with EDD domain